MTYKHLPMLFHIRWSDKRRFYRRKMARGGRRFSVQKTMAFGGVAEGGRARTKSAMPKRKTSKKKTQQDESLQEVERVRNIFPETWLWIPASVGWAAIFPGSQTNRINVLCGRDSLVVHVVGWWLHSSESWISFTNSECRACYYWLLYDTNMYSLSTLSLCILYFVVHWVVVVCCLRIQNSVNAAGPTQGFDPESRKCLITWVQLSSLRLDKFQIVG